MGLAAIKLLYILKMFSNTQVILIIVLANYTWAFKLYPRENDCSININDLDKSHPLIITTDSSDFIYPEVGNNFIKVKSGSSVDLACPNGHITANSLKSDNILRATCDSSSFIIDGEEVAINSVKCSSQASNTAKYTGNNCKNNGKEIEIGFEIDESRFIKQILVCFDDENKASLYSHYLMSKAIASEASGVPRPSFVEDDFYNLEMKVDDIYTRANQRKVVNSLLGLDPSSTKYIDNGNNFLSRGHLAAKADFIYAYEQTATFHFVNAAPQWQSFNGVHWEQLEANLRDIADEKGLDLHMYSGTYGVTTLPHSETGEEVELYIYIDSEGKKLIPVPDLYWRIVYEPQEKLAAVVLGLNNPYKEDLSNSIICEDISDSLSWISVETEDIDGGYMYACTYEDFKNAVNFAPDLEVLDLFI